VNCTEVTISLNLSDRVVDVAGEAYDCAVRVGDLPDSSLVSVRLADNRRLCVATPKYMQQHGRPATPADLTRFDCLVLSSDASQTRGWAFSMPGEADGAEREIIHLRPGGPLDCSDGQVLHEWCLAGYGIAWRSTWEVESDTAGRLRPCSTTTPPAQRHYALFPQRSTRAARAVVDRLLKHHYGQADFWAG
jgi:DNA-binding transcriptional LysR family regulator